MPQLNSPNCSYFAFCLVAFNLHFNCDRFFWEQRNWILFEIWITLNFFRKKSLLFHDSFLLILLYSFQYILLILYYCYLAIKYLIYNCSTTHDFKSFFFLLKIKDLWTNKYISVDKQNDMICLTKFLNLIKICIRKLHSLRDLSWNFEKSCNRKTLILLII